MARASASSAACTRPSLSVASTGKRATPAETDTARPATIGQRGDAVDHAARDGHPGRAGCDEHELVAADPSDRVDQPDRLCEDGRDATEDVVADRRPALGVGRPEVVDVEDRERDLTTLAAGTRQFQLDDPRHGPVVGQARQGVRVGQSLEPFGALGRGRRQPGAVDGEGGQCRQRVEIRPLVVVDDMRARPAEPDRSDRRLDAARGHEQGQIGADEGVAVGRGGLPVEGRRPAIGRFGERMARVLGLDRQAGLGRLRHAMGRDERQARPVRVRDERRAHRRTERLGADGEQSAERRVERVAGSGRRDGGRQAGTGIAGRSVAGHGSTPARGSEGRRPHRTPPGSTLDRPRTRVDHRWSRVADGPLTRGDAPLILRAMKLVVAVVHTEDASALVDALLDKEFRATRLHSSGGFLKQTNATILLGVEDAEVDEVMAIVRENCTSRTQVVNPMPPIMEPGEFFMPYPLEVEVGGATVFVVPVERFERL